MAGQQLDEPGAPSLASTRDGIFEIKPHMTITVLAVSGAWRESSRWCGGKKWIFVPPHQAVRGEGCGSLDGERFVVEVYLAVSWWISGQCAAVRCAANRSAGNRQSAPTTARASCKRPTAGFAQAENVGRI